MKQIKIFEGFDEEKINSFLKESTEFVRVISKWGTSDDQSYLDPIVQDHRMN